jgi:hypothetical protein
MSKKKHRLNLKSKRLSCEDIVIGHKFELTDAGRADFHCALCGGKGVRWYEVTRDDGKKFKVGRNCLGRARLKATPELDEKTAKHPKKKRKVETPPKVNNVVKPEEIEEFPVSDDDYPAEALDELIDSLCKK